MSFIGQYRRFSSQNKFELRMERVDENQELVGHTVQQRNWKGIVIALVVIIVVCALIVATIILVSPLSGDDNKKNKFTFEDFMSGKYYPRSFWYTWVKDENAFYYKNDDGAVVRYNCSTNTSSIIMDNSTFKELDTKTYFISPNEQFALLPYDRKKIYRYSAKSKYKVYDIDTKETKDLEGPRGTEFQYVSWSPTVDGLVFVQDNDIFYRRDMFATEAHQITTTGKVDEIFNGVPDWVYEEEVLGQDNAIWWGPDGHYFLYASFNDSEIGQYDLTYYGSMTNVYVTNKKLLYPKAGSTNPTFTLHIFNTQTNNTVTLDPPDYFKTIDHYFVTVAWRDSYSVHVAWLNRAQNMSIFTICHAENGSCYENYRFTAPSGWAEIITPKFTSDGSSYFMILPEREGAAGYFRHIAEIDASFKVSTDGPDGKRKFVTTGQFDVIRIIRYDDSTEQLYYLAYRTGDPTSRHLFRTTTNSDNGEFQKPVCITCSISKDCDWVTADFPDTGDNYVLKCLGPGVPTYTLRSITNFNLSIVFEDNKDIAAEISKLSLPRKKYLHIPLNNKETMWAKLSMPYESDDEEDIEYSLLVSVYGGPNSQKVTKSFSLGWEEYLASTHNIIIASVDPRGSSGRGDTWRHANYRNLGTTEVDDTITAIRYLNNLKYVGDHSAIWGWSYGGFLTALAIGRGTDALDCGISVAPVTDFRYYDSIYTERYMGLPDAKDNLEAYSYANASKYAENFRKSRFMVVHGTGDDNVHFQNTAQLIRALTEANVYYRSQIYTDSQHSINEGNSRRHLYNTLEDFLLQCYGGRTTKLDELNKASAEN